MYVVFICVNPSSDRKYDDVLYLLLVFEAVFVIIIQYQYLTKFYILFSNYPYILISIFSSGVCIGLLIVVSPLFSYQSAMFWVLIALIIIKLIEIVLTIIPMIMGI